MKLERQYASDFEFEHEVPGKMIKAKRYGPASQLPSGGGEGTLPWMETELLQPELPLLAGAVALGSVCAMIATLILFPIIDRYLRVRFRLERGGAMLLLLGISLFVGVVTGIGGYFWLKEKDVDEREEPTPTMSAEQRPTAVD